MKKSHMNRQPAAASKRAAALIETLIKEMQQALNDPTRMSDPKSSWTQIFGNENIITNVIKLGKILAELPVHELKGTPEAIYREEEQVSEDDLALFQAWLREEGRTLLNAP